MVSFKAQYFYWSAFDEILTCASQPPLREIGEGVRFIFVVYCRFSSEICRSIQPARLFIVYFRNDAKNFFE